MDKILVEMLASTSCNGTHGVMPDVIKALSEELNVEVEFKPYLMWNMDSADNQPNYISTHLTEIRNGSKSNLGFFINGEWFDQRYHNADDVIRIRQKFINVAELNPDRKNINLLGQSMDVIKIKNTSMNELQFSDSIVSKEMGAFSTDFQNIWFFEGSIKKLSIDGCPVESFTYKGYDINKLIEIAEKHPEIFESKDTNESAKMDIQKVNIDDVNITLVTLDELEAGNHPCFLAGSIASNSKMYRAIVKKFGGWGYKAVHGEKVCGWMGIMPKNIACKDLGYVTQCDIPNESVLCLTCYMGGGNYAPQYHRIGIAKKMINQAIKDAKVKGYQRVEAYPHPEIISVLEKYGFACSELRKTDEGTQKYYYYDLH